MPEQQEFTEQEFNRYLNENADDLEQWLLEQELMTQKAKHGWIWETGWLGKRLLPRA
jgi:hypothetical protein